MECVATGASLKSGGFIKPDVQIDPNSYGTIFWPVPGLPDYFKTIIPANSSYPLPPQVTGIAHSDPGTLRIPVPLVKKLPYYENGKTIYKYYHLGDYDCYIKPTGEPPLVDIAMELNSDKDLITTLTHKQTRESVRFEKLDHLNGKEITLQEIKEPAAIPTSPASPTSPTATPPISPRKWSQEQLTKALHVARMLVDDIAEHSQDKKVQNKKTELLDLIQNIKDPNDTRFVLRRIQELLNALINSHDITQFDFQSNMEALKEIEKQK